jgi:hypothetical protein
MVDALLTITVQSTAAINMQTEASRAKKVARTKVMDVLIRPLEPPLVSELSSFKRPTSQHKHSCGSDGTEEEEIERNSCEGREIAGIDEILDTRSVGDEERGRRLISRWQLGAQDCKGCKGMCKGRV